MNVLKADSSKKPGRKDYHTQYYQNNKEEINRKKRERRKLRKSQKVETQFTSTNSESKNPKVNVEVKSGQTKWEREKKQEFQREWVKAKRDEKEGVNDNALENEGLSVNIKDFEAAEKLIGWLEKVKAQEDKFPRKWLKKCLVEKKWGFLEGFYWTFKK